MSLFSSFFMLITGILIIIFGLYLRNKQTQGEFAIVYGTIKGINEINKKIIVSYFYDGLSYEQEVDAMSLFMANEVPEVGLKVQIKIKNSCPSQPINLILYRAIGRGFDPNKRYVDNSKKSLYKMIIAGILLVIGGVISIIVYH
ncbi:hypothetical protein [Ruminococcus sp.]|uniref:hypothetical protein n=1 Tax=Ruminococcus sp. TaxID=41978 RepID=UPI0025EF23BA|nr:hypothetical protein [Ruminococcus sp.]